MIKWLVITIILKLKHTIKLNNDNFLENGYFVDKKETHFDVF
jgi:hypothetical protein